MIVTMTSQTVTIPTAAIQAEDYDTGKHTTIGILVLKDVGTGVGGTFS
jgi:hypothetical protein